jgi:hypothetical protein
VSDIVFLLARPTWGDYDHGASEVSSFPSLKLSATDRAVFHSIGHMLTPNAKSLFEKQMAQYNKVQRSDDHREVCLYKTRPFHLKPLSIDSDVLFPKSQGEFKLGNVTLKDNKNGDKVLAIVWVVSGRVFSITFNKSPKALAEDFSVDSVKLLNDPMEFKTPSIQDVPYFVPDDHATLLAKNQRINGWQIIPFEEVWSVEIEGASTFYVLAEKEDVGLIAARENDSSRTLHLVRTDDDAGKSEVLGKSLEESCGRF